jgi:hypothetical protein
VNVLDPAELVAVSETVWSPGVEYRFEGFWAVLVLPSPNDQLQEVGVFVDESVNETLNGAVPEVGVPENPATGVIVAAATLI